MTPFCPPAGKTFRSRAGAAVLALLLTASAGAQPTVEDVAGAYDGTVYGATSDTGVLNGALRFSDNDYVDLGGVDVVGTAITLSTWVYLDQLPSNTSENDYRFISKATGSSVQNHFWMVGIEADGANTLWRFRLRAGGGTAELVSPTGLVSANRWYHVAATYDGSRMRIYVDGVEVAGVDKTGTLDSDPSVRAALGNQPPGADDRALDGALDDVRVYDRALSAGEVGTLAGGGDVSTGLQHHWPLDAVAVSPPARGVCYAVADQLADQLFTLDLTASPPVQTARGATGTTNLEAMGVDPTTGALYAFEQEAGQARLGTVNTAVGTFVGRDNAVGSVTGVQGGAATTLTVVDVDGMAYDYVRDVWYGAVRTDDGVAGDGLPDLLFAVDPETGRAVPDAFGAGVDFVEVEKPTSTAHDIDALAYDPFGRRLLGLANSAGSETYIVEIDVADGSTTNLGRVYVDGATALSDGEGLAVDGDGRVLLVVGAADPGQYVYALTGLGRGTITATFLTALDADPNADDFESLSCLQYRGDGAVGGRLFDDLDGNGADDAEPGLVGVSVDIVAAGPDGALDTADDVTFAARTGLDGRFDLYNLDAGLYRISVDAATLPSGATLTTGNEPQTTTLASGGAYDAGGIGYDGIVYPAAETGDYRSLQSGTWSSASTWERYDGTDWVLAPSGPVIADGEITVRTGHAVTVSSAIDVDQVVVEAGGQLTVDALFGVRDGVGTDLSVLGTVAVRAGGMDFEVTSVSTFESGSFFDVQGSLVRPEEDATVVFRDGAKVDVRAGATFQPEDQVTVLFESGAHLWSAGTVDVRNSAVLRFEGTGWNDQSKFDNVGTVVQSDLSTIEFGPYGLYVHLRDGGALPDPTRTTWEDLSLCYIYGDFSNATTTAPTNLAHSFSHFAWGVPNQTGALSLSGQPTVRDLLAVDDTGAGSLSWITSGDAPLVAGAFRQSGGTFELVAGSGSPTMDVAGDVDVSGGTFSLSDTGDSQLQIAGDVTLSGGTVTTNSGGPRIVLDGAAPQTITVTGAIQSGKNIDLRVDSGAEVTAGSALDLPDDVTVSGTLDMAGYSLEVGDDLSIYGDLTNPDRITFDGGEEQVFRSTPALTVPRVVVDKSAGAVVLFAGTTLALTGGVTLSGGTLDLNGQSVTLKADGGRTATVVDETGGAGTFDAIVNDANLAVERFYGTGTDGWRMLAVPQTGVSYSALNGTFHTQGGDWASTRTGTSNLRQLDVAAQDWTELGGADAAFAPGEGYIFYMWAESPEGDAKLPATWTVTGPLSGVTQAALAFNTAPSDSHNLVGNPWATNLDWDATVAASTDVGTTYATWDPSVTAGGGMSGYVYYNASGGVGAAGPYVPPLQAFSVQAAAPGATLTYATSATAGYGDPVYYGRRAGGRAERSPHVRLHLEGGPEGGPRLGEAETYLVFDPAARPGRDAFDVDRLPPLAADHATLWFEAEGAPRLAFDGRSVASGAETYALHVEATAAGAYTLSWPDWHAVPEGWALTLLDHETGREVDLRATPTYTFRLDGASGAAGPEARFALRVSDPVRAGADDPLRPDRVRLAPPAPNPFADGTALRFALPDRARVHLAVYDLLGREVATLADGERGPGWHAVRWNAGGLPGGTYLYRLRVGGQVLSGKMLRLR